MHTPLQQQLVSASEPHLFDLLRILLKGRDVTVRMTDGTVKIAEPASRNTRIGNIYIAVNHPGHLILRVVKRPDFITQVHQFGQGQVFEQENSLIRAEELARKGFYEELILNFSTFAVNDDPKLPKNHAPDDIAYQQIPAGR